MKTDKRSALKELQEIPGVGKAISEDLWDLGIKRISALKRKKPEKLYDDLCYLRKMTIDRCMLYVLRTACYYASVKNPDPHLLRWWNWKDKVVQP
jgi:hypothetical protein